MRSLHTLCQLPPQSLWQLRPSSRGQHLPCHMLLLLRKPAKGSSTHMSWSQTVVCLKSFQYLLGPPVKDSPAVTNSSVLCYSKRIKQHFFPSNPPWAFIPSQSFCTDKGSESKEAAKNFLSFLSKFKTVVYSTFENPALQFDENVKTMMVKYSVKKQNIVRLCLDVGVFQNTLKAVEESVSDIDPQDIPEIISHLDSLCLPKDNAVLTQLWNSSLAHMDVYDLKDLVLLSQCVKSLCQDLNIVSRKIEERLGHIIKLSQPDRNPLVDVCKVCVNLKNLLSPSFLDVTVNLIVQSLKSESASVTLSTLSAVELFNQSSDFEWHDVLTKEVFAAMSRLEVPECSSIKAMSLRECTELGQLANVCPWVMDHPVLRTLQRQCMEGLAKCTSLVDVIKHLNLCGRSSSVLGQQVIDVVSEELKEANDYFFYQLLETCMRSDLCNGHTYWSRQLTSDLYRKLTAIVSSLTSDQLDGYLWEDRGRLAKAVLWLAARVDSIRRIMASGSGIGGKVRSQLRSRLSHDVLTGWEVSVGVEAVVDTLCSGYSISATELMAVSAHIPCLRLDDLLIFHRKLSNLLIRGQVSKVVKKQVQHLKTHIWSALEQEFETQTEVPASLVAYSKAMPLHSQHTASERKWYIWDRLLEELPKWIVQGSDRSCGRALTLLPDASCCFLSDEASLNHLITSITKDDNLYILSGLQLVEILAASGYQGSQFEVFSSWVDVLVAEVVALDWIPTTSKIKLAYHLSTLGIFHDDFLLHIFSLDFLLDLQQQMTGLQEPEKTRVHNQLACLNRAVWIECPHLAVPFFSQPTGFTAPTERDPSYLRVQEALTRLCGGDQWLQSSLTTPYGYLIDFQLIFNNEGNLVEPDTAKAGSQDVERLVVLFLEPWQFCQDNTDTVAGTTKAVVRQLQILGYHLLLIPQHTVTSMALQSQEGLDSYLTEQVSTTLGWNLLPQRTSGPHPHHPDSRAN